MTPLQKVAMGLVLVAVDPYFAARPVGDLRLGYDGLPDALGWVLVLLGVHALGDHLSYREVTWWASLLAAVAAVPLYLPEVVAALPDEIAWAAGLPQSVALAALCWGLARTPTGGAAVPRRRLQVLAVLLAALGVAPAVILGGRLLWLVPATGTAAVVTLLVLVVTLFALSSVVPPRSAEAPLVPDRG